MSRQITLLPELSREEMESLLESERVGRLGLNDIPQPYVVPTDFAYYDGAIYIHTPDEGRKAMLARKNPYVCFEVDRYNQEVTDYQSVIIRGIITEVDDEIERQGVMMHLLEKARRSGHPGKEKKEMPKMRTRISIFKIRIEDMTGVKSPDGGHP